MAIKRLDEAAKLQLVEWCSNGQNYEEIAKKLGVTGKVVQNWIIETLIIELYFNCLFENCSATYFLIKSF